MVLSRPAQSSCRGPQAAEERKRQGERRKKGAIICGVGLVVGRPDGCERKASGPSTLRGPGKIVRRETETGVDGQNPITPGRKGRKGKEQRKGKKEHQQQRRREWGAPLACWTIVNAETLDTGGVPMPTRRPSLSLTIRRNTKRAREGKKEPSVQLHR